MHRFILKVWFWRRLRHFEPTTTSSEHRGDRKARFSVFCGLRGLLSKRLKNLIVMAYVSKW